LAQRKLSERDNSTDILRGAALPTAHGFQEYWGYLYHLDAMQQVSFPDINKTPTQNPPRYGYRYNGFRD